MINEIQKDAEERMKKSLAAMIEAFKKVRTGRAHPSLLDGINVDYYGNPTPINQLANVNVEDGRTLAITPWEKPLVPEIEKAIMKSDLGITPATSGETIRVPMPMLTEETRKGFIKQARAEAEKGRVSIRNVRRDANSSVKDLLKEKEISEDEERQAENEIQKLTDKFIADVDSLLVEKEKDLMQV
ncbi:ribosome recycling factor [Bermanella marisrubri]|uniref:Ribosome-recycling factor n=1 Tax=Bermanella marisrubri TaxID=207949 RepID=Q1N1X1_9GAMM|nr:ribosome recycling factor [Bermanella marisrubri]EAT12160.1 ribosome recycling factor [Oceanobacter sp. RED65] [Bermanella marisrubri]QIZ83636.1 ribosome recycling factor [Bermanella marisrubri]